MVTSVQSPGPALQAGTRSATNWPPTSTLNACSRAMRAAPANMDLAREYEGMRQSSQYGDVPERVGQSLR